MNKEEMLLSAEEFTANGFTHYFHEALANRLQGFVNDFAKEEDVNNMLRLQGATRELLTIIALPDTLIEMLKEEVSNGD